MKLRKDKIINFCDRVSLFSLFSIAFFLPISKGAIESFSTLAIVFFFFKKILQRKNIIKTNLNHFIFIYLLVCFLSVFLSSNIKISSKTFIAKILEYTAFFFVVVETLNTEKRINELICVLLSSSLILGVDGIYQYFTHKDFLRHRPEIFVDRIYASFGTPNSFGCYLSMALPFTIIHLLSALKNIKVRVFSFLLFLLLFICLILTVSRGAWFAFLASALFMSLWIRPLALFFIIIAIIITVTQPFYHTLLRKRIAELFVFMDNSSLDRKIIWQAAWNMFMKRPWIGVGLGTFMFNFRNFIKQDYMYGIPYAHNCYLQMASEIGIIGLVSFLCLLSAFFFFGIRALNTGEKSFSWYILLAALAGTLGYCVQMGVDTTFYSLDLGILFWLILGLATAISSNKILQLSPNN